MCEVVPEVMEGEIMDICPLVFRRPRFQHAEPVVNPFFSQAIAALRCKDVCSISISTCPEILVERLTRSVDNINIAPLSTFVSDADPPDLWSDIRVTHLQPVTATVVLACAIAHRVK